MMVEYDGLTQRGYNFCKLYCNNGEFEVGADYTEITTTPC